MTELKPITENTREFLAGHFTNTELGLIRIAVDMVAFATDSSGNLFCFPESSKPLKSGESPIIFFDHDFETIEIISASFPEWLDTYCKLAVQ